MKRIQLDELNKKPPFQVPDGYFDRLTLDIQARIQTDKKRIWIPAPQLKWALTAAAVVLLLMVVWIYQNNSTPTAEQLLALVDEEALLDYLDINDVSETELLDGIHSTDLHELWQETEALDELRLDTEDVDQLLLEYEIDINS